MMNNTHGIAELISKVVAGDLHAFEELLKFDPVCIDKHIEALPEFTLAKHAVRKVLLSLLGAEFNRQVIQQWASFVRHGYFGRMSGPRGQVSIWYDESAEDPIADAVCRLDELGDEIDGTITSEELTKMIREFE